ncbi:transmembrane protein 272-like [Cololabis saira]|uniref:transmembrane protein 272-like n=1 Tax=Cololabis saira TaxID=129043 RepID=UPI002AD3BCA0|nr:transmembrane protein 272-like [Cololabis saira]
MSTSDLYEKLPQVPVPVRVISKIICCILPIAQIAIGAVYLHDCPRQPYIPIYLIVFGVLGVLNAVLPILPNTLCMALNSLMSLLLFCWFIAGNVWIYSIYQPNYDKNTTSVDPYCDKTLYLFSFWTTTLVYILLGLSVPIAICACLCACCNSD